MACWPARSRSKSTFTFMTWLETTGCIETTEVWIDEYVSNSTFDLEGFEKAEKAVALMEERKRIARQWAPPPVVLTRRPQVMHSRSPLAALPRSSC